MECTSQNVQYKYIYIKLDTKPGKDFKPYYTLFIVKSIPTVFFENKIQPIYFTKLSFITVAPFIVFGSGKCLEIWGCPVLNLEKVFLEVGSDASSTSLFG